LVRILDGQNPITEFNTGIGRKGVFDEDPEQPLVLLVDFKNNGEDIFPYVESQLSALREKNYLTYFNGHEVVQGPVTVVGTGNTPFELLASNTTYRDIFFDAPLDKLTGPRTSSVLASPLSGRDAGQGNSGIDPALGSSQFTSENSYYASVNFGSTIGFPWRGNLNKKQHMKLKAQIRAAHEKGLKARYWNTPAWPIGLRNHIWRVLVREGADVLNVDDLRAATRVDWRRRNHRD